jgi:GT2 family glycosyltransferase
MLLSVVIPCHGGVADTRACIASLLAQEEPSPIEIVVVDNDSRDGTGDLAAEFGGAVRVLPQSRNLGFAGGVNRGVQAAEGTHLLILNNDTLAAPRMVRRLLDALHGDPRIALAAPVSNRVKGRARIDVGALGEDAAARADVERALTETAGGRIEDAETLAGLCLLLRRALIEEIGGFDERFALGNFEDDDFCLRARLRGHRLVIVRDAFLHHWGSRTFHALGVDYREVLAAHERLFAAKWQDDPAGAAWLARGDRVRAGELAARALSAHPHWPDAHWLRADGAAARGRTAAAIAHVRAFLDACPCHPQAALRLAQLHLAAGDETAGRRALQQALARLPLHGPAAAATLAQLAERCSADGRGREALEHLRSAVDLDPQDAELHNRLGAALMDRGEFAPAAEHLARAAELGSPHGETNLGVCQWRSGDIDGAIATLRAAAVRDPDNALARHNLAQACAALTARSR